jgi:3-dehydroquinate dehydratase-1
MSHQPFRFPSPGPAVVGSFGDAKALSVATPENLALECDIAEIRLDLFHLEVSAKGRSLWEHLLGFPLLLTARCHAEGSPFELGIEERREMLELALVDALLVDIEVASIPEMAGLISEITEKKIPWIASFHDFKKLPSSDTLKSGAAIAKQAGAAAFKCAARLEKADDLIALASFQSSDQGIPVATMGMGPLAPVSRLLCAQVGSILNYGYLGTEETAPGQWSARQLREGILSLTPLS